MTFMELEFPEDVKEARVRAGRNISEAERWLSIAAGIGLATYGLTKRRGATALMLAAFGGLLVRRGASGHCDTYELLGLNTAGTGQDTRRALGGSAGVIVDETVTINQQVELLYRFWRNLENLPQFMNHLESVQVLDERRSHWKAKGPGGSSVEWTAEIINEHPNELIAWRSVEGADVENAGTVRFTQAIGGRGTIVKVDLQYDPPAGVLGTTVARLCGEAPEKQIAVDLFRFKQLMETGEIARTEGQPAGRAKSTSRKYDDFLRK